MGSVVPLRMSLAVLGADHPHLTHGVGTGATEARSSGLCLLTGLEHGLLRLACSMAMGQGITPGACRQAKRRYPNPGRTHVGLIKQPTIMTPPAKPLHNWIPHQRYNQNNGPRSESAGRR